MYENKRSTLKVMRLLLQISIKDENCKHEMLFLDLVPPILLFIILLSFEKRFIHV